MEARLVLLGFWNLEQLREPGLGAKQKCGGLLFQKQGEESCFLSSVVSLSQPVTVLCIFPLISHSLRHGDLCRVNTDPLGPTPALSMSSPGMVEGGCSEGWWPRTRGQEPVEGRTLGELTLRPWLTLSHCLPDFLYKAKIQRSHEPQFQLGIN